MRRTYSLSTAMVLFSLGAVAQPVNDDCANALHQELTIGADNIFSGDNTGATYDSGLGLTAVWHSFTTTECAGLTVSYCGSGFTSYQVGLTVDCGTPLASFHGDNEGCSFTFAEVPAGTYLLPIVGSPAGPYSVSITTTPCDPYCTGAGQNCGAFVERITNVSFGTINNASACINGYHFYAEQSTTLTIGTPTPITVANNPNAFFPEDRCAAWFDWNQDHDLDDAGEMYLLPSPDGGATFAASITPPAGALLGATRMRTRIQYYDGGGMLPCGETYYGEVEDYSLNIASSIGIAERTTGEWSIFPNPGNGDFTIANEKIDGPTTIEVRDMMGRSVYSTNRIMKIGTLITLDLDGLAAGTYNLSLVTPAGRSVSRLMVR